jgi:hypothetical protein
MATPLFFIKIIIIIINKSNPTPAKVKHLLC